MLWERKLVLGLWLWLELRTMSRVGTMEDMHWLGQRVTSCEFQVRAKFLKCSQLRPS